MDNSRFFRPPAGPSLVRSRNPENPPKFTPKPCLGHISGQTRSFSTLFWILLWFLGPPDRLSMVSGPKTPSLTPFEGSGTPGSGARAAGHAGPAGGIPGREKHFFSKKITMAQNIILMGSKHVLALRSPKIHMCDPPMGAFWPQNTQKRAQKPNENASKMAQKRIFFKKHFLLPNHFGSGPGWFPTLQNQYLTVFDLP